MPDYEIENLLYEQGFRAVCGVDEAGRGPLCGPVVAAAVILAPGTEIPGLNDSKKLTAKKREALFDVICEKALAFGIAQGSVEEINALNILEADLLAMRRAIASLHTQNDEPYPADFALIDGNIDRDFPIPAKAVVKGDSLSMSISAASVLAKVTRDRMCDELDRTYPQYGIAKHKGYGTKDHMDALRKYGPSPIHRTKFIRFLNEPAEKSNE
ncbi:MAG: ribonuclease HII [Clostridia bacterium]|nr:ribonuclease HII [Clostridia bacterium]